MRPHAATRTDLCCHSERLSVCECLGATAPPPPPGKMAGGWEVVMRDDSLEHLRRLLDDARGGRGCSDRILCSISGSFCRWVYRYGILVLLLDPGFFSFSLLDAESDAAGGRSVGILGSARKFDRQGRCQNPHRRVPLLGMHSLVRVQDRINDRHQRR